jgi:hypothetical protein
MAGYMSDNPRFRKLAPTATKTHRFEIGVLVAYKASAFAERAHFRVTRLLPDGGQGLQYRVRSERDGQERVVLEANLERP